MTKIFKRVIVFVIEDKVGSYLVSLLLHSKVLGWDLSIGSPWNFFSSF